MQKETSGLKLRWDFILLPQETIFNFNLPVNFLM
jgi:hypothetical protein